MEQFCKLFESEKYGQILVKIDNNDGESPEVRLYTQPPNLGVCSVANSYDDSEFGWDAAQLWFNAIDLELAESCISTLFRFVFREPSISQEEDAA